MLGHEPLSGGKTNAERRVTKTAYVNVLNGFGFVNR